MRITKEQLRQIIKEEIESTLREADKQLVDNIPQGAIVGPMSDPLGIFYYVKDQEGTDGEIYAGQFDSQSWETLTSREDLKFMYRRNEISGEEFHNSIPKYWVINAIKTHLNGYGSSSPAAWVWEQVGYPTAEAMQLSDLDFEDVKDDSWFKQTLQYLEQS